MPNHQLWIEPEVLQSLRGFRCITFMRMTTHGNQRLLADENAFNES